MRNRDSRYIYQSSGCIKITLDLQLRLFIHKFWVARLNRTYCASFDRSRDLHLLRAVCNSSCAKQTIFIYNDWCSGFFRMSWLKQQQLKLAARRDERSPAKLWRQETGNRMIGELRNVQRSRLRHDGYASDSAVLDDDDDVWTVNPMHGQVCCNFSYLYLYICEGESYSSIWLIVQLFRV